MGLDPHNMHHQQPKTVLGVTRGQEVLEQLWKQQPKAVSKQHQDWRSSSGMVQQLAVAA